MAARKHDSALRFKRTNGSTTDFELVAILPWRSSSCPRRTDLRPRTTGTSFGALGAVWGYSHLGALLVALARRLLVCPAFHYVNDYGAIT
eukprot:12800470-Heterocapsa_arctica.AAC.1